ncbi:Plasmodium exported protein, unknown function [Plasmodium gallinaceum]|uniref:Fam-h protein n=1 Tax=Plasmodium gallinaceum TaxID=5849 RepID=A0A1J1GU48_PLAGA|nr:Plasmodium exported protein, unknown function [Plasmodium gallinaceum]CRG96010.1 Plasmodium exported protein, unknown function [Plasmodium gallinaceum]
MRDYINSNFILNSRCITHTEENFVIEDISTLKKYRTIGKINKLFFFIKISLFTLLIWILLYCENYNYRSWTDKYNLKNKLDLGSKRSLAEGKEVIEPKNEELKVSSSNIQTNLEENNTKVEKLELKEDEKDKKEIIKIENENENVVEIKRESNKKVNSLNLMQKYKSFLRIFNIVSIVILPIMSMTLSIISLSMDDKDNKYVKGSNIVTALYLVLNSILLLDLKSNSNNM